MSYKILIISIITSFCSTFYYSQNFKTLKKGNWYAYLQLNSNTRLPFKLEIAGTRKKPTFTVHNAEEKILLTSFKELNDSLQVDFPNFHSFIRFVVKNKTEIHGTWTNLNKGSNYKIPFSANFKQDEDLCKNKTSNNLSGKWKTTFGAKTQDEEFAVGVFKSEENSHKLSGTFLTETGDYRFLEGKSCGEFVYLSCFDGSHAFYFAGTLDKGEIQGNFYSGKHYSTTWNSVRDEKFELRNPDSLTYLVKNEAFSFKLKDLNGKEFNFPQENYKNKLTIIQIMGTWCPNCLDETKFLKEMYELYHEKGLEIISVAYETPTNFDEQVQKVKLLKTRLNLDFTFLIGGQANKSLASEQFSMLNQIISFPTAIFIDKNGEVVKIHTGFNGPGTGEIYNTYKKETIMFIETLLSK